MTQIRLIVEADTQEELDMYCDILIDLCGISMFRNGTINRHFDDKTWKKTTFTIHPYMIKDDFNFKHRNDNHKCSNCKWFDGKQYCFSGKAKGVYEFEIKISYPESQTDCGSWEAKLAELKGERE